jgi:hypothetical protein
MESIFECTLGSFLMAYDKAITSDFALKLTRGRYKT